MNEHPTPNGSRIYAQRWRESVVEVTEAVQALYDMVLSSMDFGSGFMTVEDLVPLRALAEACGFDTTEIDEHYPDGKFVKWTDADLPAARPEDST